MAQETDPFVTTTTPIPDTIAAVDLGSNSFHLAISRVVDGELRMVDSLKERVQLAAGLGPDKHLSDEAIARALDCLQRFGQRLEDVPAAGVRAVATDALRVAKNSRLVMNQAEAALGHPIELLSGTEEARLIYRGVVEVLPYRDGARQLVMDIGGGSTECILGVGLRPEHLTSLHQGCVSFTKRFFADGAIDDEGFRRATYASRLQFERLRGPYFRRHWSRVVGASGTINAIHDLIRANDWGTEITLPALIKLRRALLDAGHAQRLSIEGLKPNRRPVIAGGLAILLAAFQTLPIDCMTVSKSALREGVMLDHLGRLAHEDVRERTIARLMERYRIDEDQAQRVEGTALVGLRRSGWLSGPAYFAARRYLSWAARLHEVGLMLSFHGYHKHGAYVVAHSDMAGFSQDDKNVVATLVATHRRKITRELFAELPSHLVDTVFRLALLLRLSVKLHRNRSWRPLPELDVTTGDRWVKLSFPDGYLEEHPLTAVDFEDEATRLKAVGIRLEVT